MNQVPIPSAHSKTQHLVEAIGNRFAVEGEFVSGGEINSGLINLTYQASYRQPDGSIRRVVLQAINSHVFKDPKAVMRNVERVTSHINSRVLSRQKDLGGQTLNLLPGRDGGSWAEDEEGIIWRCYNFIEGCVTYDIVQTPRQAYQAAHAFGAFQDLVSDLDSKLIEETIPNFHNTPSRFARLMEVARADPAGRMAKVAAEFDFICERKPMTNRLLDLAAAGEIPVRITHNDTKINNVMIDAITDEAVCVIDLDTVMPGLALYDFGDLVRAAVSPAAEDETELTKVCVRLPFYEAIVEGYLKSAADFLNPVEIQHLPFSAKLITLELAIRFLTDHIEGDVYFKTKHPEHNLDRCRNQLHLLKSMEALLPE
jgi:hypothetical protein